jgi:hypothetical protein
MSMIDMLIVGTNPHQSFESFFRGTDRENPIGRVGESKGDEIWRFKGLRIHQLLKNKYGEMLRKASTDRFVIPWGCI